MGIGFLKQTGKKLGRNQVQPADNKEKSKVNILSEKQQEIKFSIFENKFKTEPWTEGTDSGLITLDEFIRATQEGVWKDFVLNIRNAMASHGRKSPPHETAKAAAPAITLSTICSSRETDEKVPISKKLVAYTYLLQVDLDLKDSEKAEEWKERLGKDQHSVFSAISPSGDGVKAALVFSLPETEITPENLRETHNTVYLETNNYLQMTYGVQNDKAVKDPFRLCFVLWDPDIIYNPDAVPLQIIAPKKTEVPKKPERFNSSSIQLTDKMRDNLEWKVERALEKVRTARVGERHNITLAQSAHLGGFISGGYLDEKEIRWRLLVAVRANPTNTTEEEKERLKEINDGINYGKSHFVALLTERNYREKEDETPTNLDEKQIINFVYGPDEEDAKLALLLFDNRLRCSKGSKGMVFFLWDKGLWNEIEECDEALASISEKLQTALWSFHYYFGRKLKELGYDENKKLDKEEQRIKDLLKHQEAAIKKIRQVGKSSHHRGIVYWLKRKVKINPEILNSKPNLIHFSDGVYDEETDEFREHRMDDYLTLTTGMEYPRQKSNWLVKYLDGESNCLPNPDETGCPAFWNYTLLCHSDDKESSEIKGIIRDLTWIMATMVSGSKTNSCLFHTGAGNNGKSLWIRMVAKALGTYSTTIPADATYGKGREKSIFLNECRGIRFLIMGDLNDNAVIDNSFKCLVSDGEQDQYRTHFGKYSGYKKQFVAAGFNNAKLKITEDNPAIRDRFVFFPWQHQFPKEGRQLVPYYEKQYSEELSGIMRFILDSLRYWNKELQEGRYHEWSDFVSRFNSEEYERSIEVHSLVQFLNEIYEVDTAGTIQLSKVMDEYIEWCNENKIPPNDRANRKTIKGLLPRGLTIKQDLKFQTTEGEKRKAGIIGLRDRNLFQSDIAERFSKTKPKKEEVLEPKAAEEPKMEEQATKWKWRRKCWGERN